MPFDRFWHWRRMHKKGVMRRRRIPTNKKKIRNAFHLLCSWEKSLYVCFSSNLFSLQATQKSVCNPRFRQRNFVLLPYSITFFFPFLSNAFNWIYIARNQIASIAFIRFFFLLPRLRIVQILFKPTFSSGNRAMAFSDVLKCIFFLLLVVKHVNASWFNSIQFIARNKKMSS